MSVSDALRAQRPSRSASPLPATTPFTFKAQAAPEIKRASERLAAIAADGTFSGYASLFGVADLGGDVVERGAFRRALGSRGAGGIKLLFQHDPTQPIGVWETLTEDARGLYVTGRLMPEVAKAREVLALMKAGALDGLSIGFRTVKGTRDPTRGVRLLQEIDLWEISIVTFPMQPDARVSAVRTRKPATAATDRHLVARIRRATHDLSIASSATH